MLLTIGMIVKNEEKYLERCLNGIKPILEQVDSELIIADTGSTDRTVEIARQFTDNVFYFEWIKDFAAARNSTLEKAQGEWYMFIDADEIFGSCDRIIHFFNSGEYKKYNSASYIVRNLLSNGKSAYTDFPAPRLTHILPTTRFIHPVHECLNTYGNPVRLINDVAMHYGYSAEVGSEEEMQKFERNSSLLMERLKTEKPSAMLYHQLYDCYVMHDEKKALEYLEKGIEFCIETRSTLLPSMYQSLANYWIGEEDYGKTLEICRDYFAMSKEMRPTELTTDVEMHGFAATALNCLGKCSEAVSEYRLFFRKYGEYKSGRLVTDDVRYTRAVISREENMTALFSEYLHAAIMSEQYSEAAELAGKFPVYKYPSSKERIAALVVRETELLSRTGYKGCKAVYDNLNPDGKVIFGRLLRGKIAEGDGNAIHALGELSEENRQLAYIYDTISSGESAEQLIRFAEAHDMNEYADILYFIIRNGGDISDFITLKNVRTAFCVSCCARNFKDFYVMTGEYDIKNIKSTSAYPAAALFFEAAAKLAASAGENTDKLINAYSKLKNQPTSEMELLNRKIKANIRAFIASGNIGAAQAIFEEYKKLNLPDSEIDIIESELNKCKEGQQ